MLKFFLQPNYGALLLGWFLLWAGPGSLCYGQQKGESDDRPFYDYGLAYTGELWANVSGGLNTGMRYMDNVDLTLAIDLDRLTGIAHSRLFFYGLGNHGGSISELAGDVQGVSNIEADGAWKLYEAWFQKGFPALNASIRVGRYDVNSEFDLNRTGLLFINSSHGIGAAFGNSGVLGPSVFPYTSLGARIRYMPADGLAIQAAVADAVPSVPAHIPQPNPFPGDPDGVLVAAEVNYAPASYRKQTAMNNNLESPYRMVMGGWLYTKPRSGWTADAQREYGAYATLERVLYRHAGQPRQVSAFVRIGVAQGKVNPFSTYAGAGVVGSGLIGGREEDQAGIAVAVPWSSEGYRQFLTDLGYRPAGYEMNLELSYLLALSSLLQLQLDTQYILNPGTAGDVDNAWVAGLRFMLSI